MLEKLPAVIRREVFTTILGDVFQSEELSKSPLCGGYFAELTEELSSFISLKVPREYRSQTQLACTNAFMVSPDPFEIIRQCIPVSSSFQSIDDDKWEEWLQICWGNDSDIISMIGLTKLHKYYEDYINAVHQLPLIQNPKSSISKTDRYTDSHIHSGNMCPPIIKWAYHMKNILVSHEYEDEFTIFDNKRLPDTNHNLITKYYKEYKVKQYIWTSRILLATIFDYCIGLFDSDILEKGTDVRIPLHKAIVEFLKGEISVSSLVVTIQQLFNITKPYSLEAVLNNIELKPETDLITFIEAERESISRLIWDIYHNTLNIHLKEILLLYIRCKNHWFQVISGVILRSSTEKSSNYSGLSLFKYTTELGRLGLQRTNQSHELQIATAINKTLQRYSNRVKLCIKLSLLDPELLNPTLEWLERALISTEFELVLCLRRYDFTFDAIRNGNTLVNPDALCEKMKTFITNVINDNRFKKRVIGIDIVGPEEYFDWDEYIPILNDIREFLNEKLFTQNCHIAFHCGEDTLHPLKGIADIWAVFNQCKLHKGDRLAHGLDLIDVSRKSPDGDIPILTNQWKELKANIDNLITFIETDISTQNLHNLWDELKKTISVGPYINTFNGILASEIAQGIYPFVCKNLIDKGIILEVCPTSNWQIGGVALPTKHPVNVWCNFGGSIVIGTDDPAVLPCTIESEYFSVNKSKNK
ncbi:MAG: hypothetical protein JW712_10970 [Dehalococcoidales bacterium]|nr:hypothetical protein [Dehalococcoidales bacterium]